MLQVPGLCGVLALPLGVSPRPEEICGYGKLGKETVESIKVLEILKSKNYTFFPMDEDMKPQGNIVT